MSYYDIKNVKILFGETKYGEAFLIWTGMHNWSEDPNSEWFVDSYWSKARNRWI